MLRWIAALAALGTAMPALAGANASEPTAQEKAAAARFEQSLHPQSGSITVPGAQASLNLGDRYVFYAPDEARRIIVDAWGNPPAAADGILGLVMPKGGHVFDSWGAVVEYENTGHVDDADAASQDYDKLLADLKQASEENNAERKKGGFAPAHLVGWAQQPSYDAAGKALIWARDIRFEDVNGDTLNYDVRKLARTGVLSLNMIAGMDDLPAIRTAAVDLGKTVSFAPGAAYADFNPQTDEKADFGLAGLVAAGAGLAVAKKVGLLGLLFVFLKKGFVIVAVAVAALWRRIKRFFGRGDDEAEAGEYAATHEADHAVPQEPLTDPDPYLAGGAATSPDAPSPEAR
ncbi:MULTISPECIES: DUF2167 domain-containing protein [Sphingomonas]|uniref:DUF2167 domain-containing protein n=1 Tax=Sphingomonas TaxID=13687 RepID=UPI000DF01326|nr:MULTISPECIES: DUF2167 domain-containing protein [Sphingomonas]